MEYYHLVIAQSITCMLRYNIAPSCILYQFYLDSEPFYFVNYTIQKKNRAWNETTTKSYYKEIKS